MKTDILNCYSVCDRKSYWNASKSCKQIWDGIFWDPNCQLRNLSFFSTKSRRRKNWNPRDWNFASKITKNHILAQITWDSELMGSEFFRWMGFPTQKPPVVKKNQFFCSTNVIARSRVTTCFFLTRFRVKNFLSEYYIDINFKAAYWGCFRCFSWTRANTCLTRRTMSRKQRGPENWMKKKISKPNHNIYDLITNHCHFYLFELLQ